MKWKPGPKVRQAALLHGLESPALSSANSTSDAGYRRFTVEEADLTNSPMSLSFLKHGFAIDIQNLSQFVYAWFRH